MKRTIIFIASAVSFLCGCTISETMSDWSGTSDGQPAVTTVTKSAVRLGTLPEFNGTLWRCLEYAEPGCHDQNCAITSHNWFNFYAEHYSFMYIDSTGVTMFVGKQAVNPYTESDSVFPVYGDDGRTISSTFTVGSERTDASFVRGAVGTSGSFDCARSTNAWWDTGEGGIILFGIEFTWKCSVTCRITSARMEDGRLKATATDGENTYEKVYEKAADAFDMSCVTYWGDEMTFSPVVSGWKNGWYDCRL